MEEESARDAGSVVHAALTELGERYVNRIFHP